MGMIFFIFHDPFLNNCHFTFFHTFCTSKHIINHYSNFCHLTPLKVLYRLIVGSLLYNVAVIVATDYRFQNYEGKADSTRQEAGIWHILVRHTVFLN